MPEAEPAPLTAPDNVAGILAALSADAGLPRAALAAAVARWDDIRPALHAQLQAYVDGGDRSDRAATLCLMAIYLMAQQRDTTGFALVCTLVRDREAVEAILSDGITEDLNSILVRLFDGDPAPLRALIEAADADEFVRSASFEALAWLTAAGRLDRDETAQYLRDLYTTLQPQAASWAWEGWQQAIADLGLAELAPLVREAFARGLISDEIMSVEDFEADLKKAGAATQPMEAVSERFLTLADMDDIAEMMSHWAWFQPAKAPSAKAPPAKDRPQVKPGPSFAAARPFVATGPARNPVRDVGRNDPCPCGSGKKFKKCCLGKTA